MRRLQRYVFTVDRFNERVGNIIKYAVLAFIAMLLIEIVARYGFNSPTFWAHESTALLFGVYMMLIGGYCLLHGSHVKIDILWSSLSRRHQAIADLCTSVILFVFTILLLWQTGKRAWMSTMLLEESPSLWKPPIWPIKIIAVIAVFLIFIQGTAKFIRDFHIAKGTELD